jgi:hypothetical protein
MPETTAGRRLPLAGNKATESASRSARRPTNKSSTRGCGTDAAGLEGSTGVEPGDRRSLGGKDLRCPSGGIGVSGCSVSSRNRAS